MGQENDDVHYYVLPNGSQQNILKVSKVALRGPPDFLKPYRDRRIMAYTQMRQNFWAYQPDSWITYHVCTIMEVDVPSGDKLHILIERVDDRLEIMLGVGHTPRSFMLEVRATGRARRADRCFQLPRQELWPFEPVTVGQLLDWLSTTVCKRWQPYHILESNCQHVAEELQRFLESPRKDRLAVAPWKPGSTSVPMPNGLPTGSSFTLTGPTGQWIPQLDAARRNSQAAPDYILMGDGTLQPRIATSANYPAGMSQQCTPECSIQ